LEDEEDALRADLNPSELDFLARISGARVDNRPFRQEEHPAVTHRLSFTQLSLASCHQPTIIMTSHH
jgi:hypothetical protein